jgi:hypothetical protein
MSVRPPWQAGTGEALMRAHAAPTTSTTHQTAIRRMWPRMPSDHRPHQQTAKK